MAEEYAGCVQFENSCVALQQIPRNDAVCVDSTCVCATVLLQTLTPKCSMMNLAC